jgi:glycerone phosphate O-acyltransferase/fatty acyl-CoA reductase
MEEREIFKLENDKVKVHEKGNQMMGFLCSLIWPLIECYWMCSVYIFSLKNKNSNIELPLEKLIH